MLTEKAAREALATVICPGLNRDIASLFRKLDIPVLGLVENMAFAECECGRRSYPFGQGGVARLARDAGLVLLGAETVS